MITIQIADHRQAIQFPATVSDSPVSADDVTEGWIGLFDGHSLYGWRAESEANWRVENGVICVDQGEPGLLRTTSQFDDFELRLEFSSSDTTDSGVLLRTSPRPHDPASDCYEINISATDNRFVTGSLVERIAATAYPTTNDFNLLEVSVNQESIRVWINGEAITDYVDPRPLGRGFIGLQFAAGEARFRNIALRPLGLETLFNHQDLTGWLPHGESGFHAIVNESGDLTIAGAGYVESDGQLTNGIIQGKCLISAKGNSGVFFRCVPGQAMNGYESQIDNGFEADRTRPSNAGTGAIFRRTQARRIVSDDQLWFAKTIVVEGPHMSVWVNGYQVTDWSDQRPPDDNPRRGRRLESGTIQLQGHDAETTVRFRELVSREMAPRRY
ncbi:MAG: 3-keto-disaccharide hydrolase [Pirellulaceae bacterium]